MTEISKKIYELRRRKAVPVITLLGCLRGCLTLIIIAILTYGLIYGLRTWNAMSVLTANYNRWHAFNPKSYSVTVKYGTYGGFYGISHETIYDGKLIKTDTGYAQPAIDRLFDRAKDCALDPLFFFSPSCIEYDPQYGYPNYFSTPDFDEGHVIVVKDFVLGQDEF